MLARRAGEFTLPDRGVAVDGRDPAAAVAEPSGPAGAADPAHLDAGRHDRAGGAEPIVEHGVVTGEVRGLEVCRVVDDRTTGAARLEVGVGAHDREAFAIIHGDVPTVEALAGVVDAVAEHRASGTRRRTRCNRLAPERLLRWQLDQDPSLVGLAAVEPAEPPVPRRNVKDRVPCVAVGERADGRAVVLVCSVGVDLDLVPYAADARLARRRPGVARWGGRDRGRAGARPRAGDGRAGRPGCDQALSLVAVLRLSLGRLVGGRRAPRWPAATGVVVDGDGAGLGLRRPAPTVTVRRPST